MILRRTATLKKKRDLEPATADRIIEAAIPLFAIKGYAGVTVREVLDAANISNIGAISYYFEGKEGLYTAILKSHFESTVILAESVNNSQDSPVEKLRYTIRSIAAAYQRSPHKLKLISNEVSNPTCCFEAIKEYIIRIQSISQSIIREGIDQGYFRPDADPGCLTLAMHGIAQFPFLLPNFSNTLLPDRDDKYDYYIAQATDYLLQGILVSPQRTP